MSQIPIPLPSAVASPDQRKRASGGDPSLSAWWLGALLFASLAAVLLMGVLEWEHYRRILKSRNAPLTLGDRAIIGWLLWAKSLLPLIPLLAASVLVAAFGHRKPATVLLAMGTLLWFCWLAADLLLQSLTGNHVLDYLPYLQDALISTDRNHLQWAGDMGSIAWRWLLMLAVMSAGGVLLLRTGLRLSESLLYRFSWMGSPRACVVWTAAFTLAALGAVPAQVLFSQPLLLRRLHMALPIDLALFVPQANNPAAWARLLGRKRDAALKPGVRIVALVPDPASEEDAGRELATLHNFSDEAVSLAGWRLRDREKHQHVLGGAIQPGQSLSLVMPRGLQLNNDGDELLLVDDQGQVHHQVKYKGEMVKYGGVLTFRGEADADEFLLKLNQGVRAAYHSLHDDAFAPRPVDEAVHLDEPSPPHAVYLVLESFRAAAVSPELMQRLDAWGRRGLRLNRHYAPSNSSHLGLFTLLYGRSPLVYDPTVDADIAPQTTHTLRANGYRCTFITSGDCTNFRKMERFLNEERFDRVIQEDGNDWRDWPERDRRALFRVRDVLEKAGDQPQFVMAFLMSTHFPYAFPAEWDVHRPSGADAVTLNNWKTFDTGVLHNRYKNAALSLEEELMRLIESLDPQRHIIVVTGDHGESMSEDGALAHASRGSEAQTRVPLLMVGPRFPSHTVEQPTTHADVLPTLLHALAGRELKVRSCHGRDVLAGTQLPDQVMICPYRWKDPYDLILVRGADRLQFKIRLGRASVEAIGFCDVHGNLDLSSQRQRTPQDAVLWTEAFRREMRRIAQ
jgi:hypothetical protein